MRRFTMTERNWSSNLPKSSKGRWGERECVWLIFRVVLFKRVEAIARDIENQYGGGECYISKGL